MKIVFIGSGNVATHLSTALSKTDIHIIQIISKNIANAQKLANSIECESFSDTLNDLLEADLYIIAVADAEIKKIASHKFFKDRFLVHTCGSVKMNILSENTNQYGVFYPLQTFNKNNRVDFSEVPICLEASNDEVYNKLEKLSGKISTKIFKINSEQREKLHIAAVFVNNFVNHLFALANEIVERENIDSEILKPLISATFENMYKKNPFDIQTGPAIRNDIETIEKHLSILKNYPKNFVEVYEIISESIRQMYNLK